MANEINKNGIIGSLEALVEMAANVTAVEGPIHQLDIDLLQDQVRKLYREIQMLDEANKKEIAKACTNSTFRPIQQEKPVAEKVNPVQEIIAPAPILQEESKQEEMETVVDLDLQPAEAPEAMIQPAFEPAVQQPVVNPAESKGQGVNVNQPPVTVIDKLTTEDNSINSQLKTTNPLLNQKMNNTPILNLKTAIGINDKFMFVNELFKGDMKEFDSVIGTINSAGSEAEALEILNISLFQYKTTDKTEIVRKLHQFIHRRFC